MGEPPGGERVDLGFEVDARRTLFPLRRGPGDPTMRIDSDGTIRGSSRTPDGPVTYALRQVDRSVVEARAAGSGAAWWFERLPRLLGADDRPEEFDPQHPVLLDGMRRYPGVRACATDRLVEALIPAIIEQKVLGIDAFASWRRLVTRFGSPAPGADGPGAIGHDLLVVPDADGWRSIRSWDWHEAGVDPQRARTASGALIVAERLEALAATESPERVYAALRSLPGIGVWTAAEVGARALGDPDAVSLGDYHLPALVGTVLTGAPAEHHDVEALLRPWAGQRWRAVRLMQMSPLVSVPRRGPRSARVDHRRR